MGLSLAGVSICSSYELWKFAPAENLPQKREVWRKCSNSNLCCLFFFFFDMDIVNF